MKDQAAEAHGAALVLLVPRHGVAGREGLLDELQVRPVQVLVEKNHLSRGSDTGQIRVRYGSDTGQIRG